MFSYAKTKKKTALLLILSLNNSDLREIQICKICDECYVAASEAGEYRVVVFRFLSSNAIHHITLFTRSMYDRCATHYDGNVNI